MFINILRCRIGAWRSYEMYQDYIIWSIIKKNNKLLVINTVIYIFASNIYSVYTNTQ